MYSLLIRAIIIYVVPSVRTAVLCSNRTPTIVIPVN